jgi:hypothetical protein
MYSRSTDDLPRICGYGWDFTRLPGNAAVADDEVINDGVR